MKQKIKKCAIVSTAIIAVISSVFASNDPDPPKDQGSVSVGMETKSDMATHPISNEEMATYGFTKERNKGETLIDEDLDLKLETCDPDAMNLSGTLEISLSEGDVEGLTITLDGTTVAISEDTPHTEEISGMVTNSNGELEYEDTKGLKIEGSSEDICEVVGIKFNLTPEDGESFKTSQIEIHPGDLGRASCADEIPDDSSKKKNAITGLDETTKADYYLVVGPESTEEVDIDFRLEMFHDTVPGMGEIKVSVTEGSLNGFDVTLGGATISDGYTESIAATGGDTYTETKTLSVTKSASSGGGTGGTVLEFELDPDAGPAFGKLCVHLLSVEVEEVIETAESANCTGYDKSKNALMVPMMGSNKIKVKIGGASQQVLQMMTFESDPPGKLSITPQSPGSANQELVLSGTSVALGVQVKVDINGSKADIFEADVLAKLTKTLEIHAITEENDDVQRVPLGQMAPNRFAVKSGPNGFRDTKPRGDDKIVAGGHISTGANGVCETEANNKNISPSGVPSAQAVESFLNDKTWGNQANVHFTVTRTDHVVNYDLDLNGSLGDPAIQLSSAELMEINNSSARNSGVDYNYYITKSVDPAIVAQALYTPYKVVISKDNSSAPFITIIAHEMGHHLRGRGGHTSTDKNFLMHTWINVHGGCQIQREFWRYANK